MRDPLLEEAARLLLVTDVRLALEAIYDGADFTDVDALIDQLEDRGLKIVRLP